MPIHPVVHAEIILSTRARSVNNGCRLVHARDMVRVLEPNSSVLSQGPLWTTFYPHHPPSQLPLLPFLLTRSDEEGAARTGNNRQKASFGRSVRKDGVPAAIMADAAGRTVLT